MHRNNLTEGDAAWLALLGYVIAYDFWSLRTRHETLSGSFDRALRSPGRSLLTLVAWGALTAHLFDPAVRRAMGHASGSHPQI